MLKYRSNKDDTKTKSLPVSEVGVASSTSLRNTTPETQIECWHSLSLACTLQLSQSQVMTEACWEVFTNDRGGRVTTPLITSPNWLACRGLRPISCRQEMTTFDNRLCVCACVCVRPQMGSSKKNPFSFYFVKFT